VLADNVEKILAQIGPGDRVLDIGGWAQPFNRADVVIDLEPWETRAPWPWRPAQGGDTERFTRESWIRRDICDKEPYPFGDKEIDFVICSHTLEDVRDPLWVCSEMIRIAKRGYLEVPSRVAESCRGLEPGQVGWAHHRWLIDIAGDHVDFQMKYHKIHSHWRFSFPARYLRRLSERQRVQFLFWEGGFTYSERLLHGIPAIEQELEDFVARYRPYPPWRMEPSRRWHKALRLGKRVAAKAALLTRAR
jgi:hypothetical protein